MNQQRSRRFRSAKEAQEKDDARKEAVVMWEGVPLISPRQIISLTLAIAMGKKLSVEEKNKKSWDSNAITPGTPFMQLLATSLRYWTAQKLNSDPGWKNVSLHFAVQIFR
jgi:5'-3' exoribonuclease 2